MRETNIDAANGQPRLLVLRFGLFGVFVPLQALNHASPHILVFSCTFKVFSFSLHVLFHTVGFRMRRAVHLLGNKKKKKRDSDRCQSGRSAMPQDTGPFRGKRGQHHTNRFSHVPLTPKSAPKREAGCQKDKQRRPCKLGGGGPWGIGCVVGIDLLYA